MTRHDRIPSQLRGLAPDTTADEIADHRWARLWRQGIAEIDVERIECAALREKVIAECRRQNGNALPPDLAAERVQASTPQPDGRKVLKPLYGQKNGHSVEIKKEASK